MIKTETVNVKLTLAQLQQLDEFENRRTVIQSEIDIANKNLRLATLDCEKVTKERIYQEELLSKLTPEVEDLKKQKEDIAKEVELSYSTVLENRKETKDACTVLAERETVLRLKEENFNRDRAILDKQSIELNLRVKKAAEDIDTINRAKDAIKEAISLVTW